MGDGIQAAKAGILEIGDVFVVNKADRDGAQSTRRELRTMISMGERSKDAWTPPIVMTVASKGEGVEDVLAAVDEHREYLTSSGDLARRRLARASREIEALALGALQRRMGDVRGDARLESLADDVLSGRSDPFTAVDTLIEHL
jgi:LAO/AO transport system kinase